MASILYHTTYYIIKEEDICTSMQVQITTYSYMGTKIRSLTYIINKKERKSTIQRNFLYISQSGLSSHILVIFHSTENLLLKRAQNLWLFQKNCLPITWVTCKNTNDSHKKGGIPSTFPGQSCQRVNVVNHYKTKVIVCP